MPDNIMLYPVDCVDTGNVWYHGYNCGAMYQQHNDNDFIAISATEIYDHLGSEAMVKFIGGYVAGSGVSATSE